MLAIAVAGQGLKPVRRRRAEVAKHNRGVEHRQLALRGADQISGEATAGIAAIEDRLASLVLEALNGHRRLAVDDRNVSPRDTNCKYIRIIW